MARAPVRKTIITVAAAVLAAGSVFSVAALTAAGTAERPARSGMVPPHEIAATLTLAGISPESLAAAGVSPLECQGLFDAANAYALGADRLAILREAIGELNRAKEQVVRPPANIRDIPPDQRVSVAQRQAAVEVLIAQAFDAVTGQLTEGQTARLRSLRANARWSIPTPYLVTERSRAQWLELRSALDARALAERRSAEIDPHSAQVLAAADADAATAAARLDLAANREAIQALWDARFR